MRRVLGIVLSAALAACILAGCGGGTATEPNTQNPSQEPGSQVYKIGISQLAQHPALDATRAGLIEGLKEAGFEEGKNIVIDFESAQNETTLAKEIAQKFVTDNKDVIVAIATTTAQAVKDETSEIPVVFSAVTDPVSAGLVESIEHPGGNVTGTSDLVPVKDQLALFPKLGEQYKLIGVIYNTGEANSVFLVEECKKAAQELGLQIVPVSANTPTEVQQAAQSLVGRVDAIYIITDNTVAQAVQSVIAVANKNKLPTVGSVEEYVNQGALITTGLDYELLGRQTGKIVAEILNGKDPAEIPVQYAAERRLLVNTETAKLLGITLPDEIMAEAVTVPAE